MCVDLYITIYIHTHTRMLYLYLLRRFLAANNSQFKQNNVEIYYFM